YKPFDGALQGQVARTVTIHVTETAPVAVDDTFTLGHDHTLDQMGFNQGVLANDLDAEKDRLTVQLVDPVTHDPVTPDQLGLAGTLEWTDDGHFRYVPPPQSAVDVHLVYRLSDGLLESYGNVNIHVKRTAPTAVADDYTVIHDQTLTMPPPNQSY